jgi:hypothetical protein
MTPPAPSFAQALAPDAPNQAADPLSQRTAVLHVSYTNDRGERFDGQFTNQILTIGQRMAVEAARARMSGGVSPDAMSLRYFGLMMAMCWIKVSVTAGPEWIKNLSDSYDEGLVEAVWEQIDRHENTFCGRANRTGQG